MVMRINVEESQIKFSIQNHTFHSQTKSDMFYKVLRIVRNYDASFTKHLKHSV